ncbi:protein hu-li tai shao-like [Pollicipes pollicipes]|uniref:protein hu-li tai shao-like n=1 Tax=Pollicipes pollicipes TaxID=41117 RepID=UPI001884EF96|nr:protein hu-li tai shao-like [Pollicipes pollicipes]
MLGTLTCGLVQCSRMEAPASTNGGGGTNGLTEEEQERQRMRPADVDADMREMARRKRVEAILSSKTFKSELDRLVETGVIDGNSVGGCLQQISDMMGLVRGGLGSSRGQLVLPAVPPATSTPSTAPSAGDCNIDRKFCTRARVL